MLPSWKVGDYGSGTKRRYFVYRDHGTKRETLLDSNGRVCRYTKGGAMLRAEILNEAVFTAQAKKDELVDRIGPSPE